MNGWSRQYVYGFTGTAYITCRDLVVDVEAGNRPTQQIRKEAAAQQEVAIGHLNCSGKTAIANFRRYLP